MWRNLALNIKLTIVLMAVQAALLLLGFIWLSHWLQSSRLDELRHRLDTQSDVIESLILPGERQFLYLRDGEFAAELDHDQNIYFVLRGEDTDEPLFESEGPSEALRVQLKRTMARTVETQDLPVLLTAGVDHWLAQKTRLERGPPSAPEVASLYVAVNAQRTLDGIAEVRRLVAVAGVGILLLSAIGSFFMVSLSTRNLRGFAYQLRGLQPPTFARRVLFEPHSAEEKLLFDSYAHMERSVQAVLESQRLFIANASHELKTPIAAVTAALEVILTKPRAAEDYAETCRDILAEMQVLKRLSLGLLDLARLDGGASSATTTSLLADNIHQAITRWQKMAQERGIHLTVNAGDDLNVRVPGNAEQWEVLLGNLLDNAIKYSESGTQVCVSTCMVDSNSVRIHVIDEGIGMSTDETARLGEVFFRADSARAQGLSFGLGFAHCQRIVTQLGGTIAVSSEPSTGTCVTLSVPRAQA